MKGQKLTRFSPIWGAVAALILVVFCFEFLDNTVSAGERPVEGASPLPSSTMLQVGEELEYKVSYSFFNLGTIRFKILEKYERRGRTIFKALSLIDSNPSIPFVDLHIRFVSEIDQEMYSHSWLADDSSKSEIVSRLFVFEYDNKRVLVVNSRRKAGSSLVTAEKVDTFAISDRLQDGLSLFFYAREHVRDRKPHVVPTFIDKKQVITNINFMNLRTEAEIDAVDYPVEVVEFDGRMDYEGVYGLTGYFQGWFTNDEARIPIVARMKVILGSVKVQLQKWQRGGWQPPKYMETAAK